VAKATVVASRGQVALQLTCSGGKPCRGIVQLVRPSGRPVSAQASFSLSARGRATVRLHLWLSGARLPSRITLVVRIGSRKTREVVTLRRAN
jgi:hypothetical protein